MDPVAKKLRDAAAGLAEAARKEAIEPDGPLGQWVQAQEAIIAALADLAEHVEQQVYGAVSDLHELAKVDVARLREMIRLASLSNDRAITEAASLTVRKDQALTDIVKTMAPQMVKAIGEAVVIRERRYNWTVHWERAAGIAAAAGSLLLGGYVWGGHSSDVEAAAAAQMMERVRHCQASPIRDERTHEAFCFLKTLVAS